MGMESIGKLRGRSLAMQPTSLEIIADEIEAELAERYMELPLDADGVPIHVGDVLDWDGGRHEVFAVSGDCAWFDTDPHELKAVPFEAAGCRHIQPDTWERIIEEAYALGLEDGEECSTARSDFSYFVARCKALAGEVE